MKEWKPKEANLLTPYLIVKDTQSSIIFYEQAFGFKTQEAIKDSDGTTGHVEMLYKGTLIIMFASESASEKWGNPAKAPITNGIVPSISLYVYHENVDALFKQAKAVHTKVLQEPQDMFWGDRMTSLVDIDGYHWCFAQKVGEFDSNKMPPI